MNLDKMLVLLKKLNQNWFDYTIPEYNKDEDYGVMPKIPFFNTEEINNIPKEIKFLYNQRVFQRLNYIKQLSFIYLFNLGGCHSRLEHTLGTVIIGKKLLEECIKRNKIKLEEYEKLGLYVALFIHDSCHGPFGHSLELIKTFLIPDDSSGERIDKVLIKRYLKDPANKIRQAIEKISPIDEDKFMEFLITLFANNYDKNIFLVEILNSTVDADRLDYIMRDQYHIGLESKLNLEDLNNLCCNIKIIKKWDKFRNKLIFPSTVKAILDNLINERAKMYNEYYHGEKSKIADTMLPHVIYQFLDNFSLITNRATIKDIGLKREILNEILKLSDQDFIRFLYFVGEPWHTINLLNNLLTGHLYKSIDDWNVFSNVEKLQKDLREIGVYVDQIAEAKGIRSFEIHIQKNIGLHKEAFELYKSKHKRISFEIYLYHFIINCIIEVQSKIFIVELDFWNRIIKNVSGLRTKVIQEGAIIAGDERGKDFIKTPQIFIALPTYIPPYKDIIKFNYLPKEEEKSVPTLMYDIEKSFEEENFMKYFGKDSVSQRVKSYSTYLLMPDYLNDFVRIIIKEFKTYIKSLNWWNL